MSRSLAAILVVTAAVLSACGGASSSTTTASTTSTSATTTAATPQIGFEGIPIEAGSALAPASSTGTSDVDGIACGSKEQLLYHIHAHLSVYANGSPRTLPAGIGIPGSVTEQTQVGPVAVGGQCIYWLHTHAPDGVIHVESPLRRIYTLGNFFDVWRQPLSSKQVGGVSGKVTAVVNGQRWSRDPRAIPLLPRSVIQLDVGSPTPAPQPVSWAGTRL